MTISIIVPCYNEEKNVMRAYTELRKVIRNQKKYNYELIFVDNGSLDKTRELIKNLTNKDKCVSGIYLTRNFGPEASVWAGVMNAKGNAVIPIECDLQNPPDLISQFIEKWEEGYDIVIGVYAKTEDNFLMSLIRKSFYSFFKAISNINIPVNAGGYCLLNRKAIEAMKSLPEKYRFFRGIRAWIGMKTAFIKYERSKRVFGKSSYNFFEYLKHAERGVFGFSYLPLDMMIYGGFILVIISFIFIIGYFYTVAVFGNPIQASIPIMLAIVFFGGIQLLAISIIGKYIQIIVEETKNRPNYIIDEVKEV